MRGANYTAGLTKDEVVNPGELDVLALNLKTKDLFVLRKEWHPIIYGLMPWKPSQRFELDVLSRNLMRSFGAFLVSIVWMNYITVIIRPNFGSYERFFIEVNTRCRGIYVIESSSISACVLQSILFLHPSKQRLTLK